MTMKLGEVTSVIIIQPVTDDARGSHAAVSRAGVAAALLPNVVAAAPALPAVLLPVLAELRRGTANSVGAQARIQTANNTAGFPRERTCDT